MTTLPNNAFTNGSYYNIFNVSDSAVLLGCIVYPNYDFPSYTGVWDLWSWSRSLYRLGLVLQNGLADSQFTPPDTIQLNRLFYWLFHAASSTTVHFKVYMVTTVYRTLSGRKRHVGSRTHQSAWPKVAKRQRSRCQRHFGSTCQVAAPSICPCRTGIGGACRFAARYLVERPHDGLVKYRMDVTRKGSHTSVVKFTDSWDLWCTYYLKYCLSVCLSVCVCLFAHISWNLHGGTSPNFCAFSNLFMAVASTGNVANLRYVLPVLWMTSRFNIMSPIARYVNKPVSFCFLYFVRLIWKLSVNLLAVITLYNYVG